jgi:penicillin-binding protein activator
MQQCLRLIPVLGCLAAVGCATVDDRAPAAPHATYQDSSAPSPTVSGVGIESQDILSATDTMVRDILATPEVVGRATAPRIIMDPAYFVNDSSSRVNTKLFVNRLSASLNRASKGKLRFLGRAEGDLASKERDLKADAEVDAGTIRKVKAPRGADFILRGTITSQDAILKGPQTVRRYTNINFRLQEVDSDEVVWENNYDFTKEAQDDVIYR